MAPAAQPAPQRPGAPHRLTGPRNSGPTGSRRKLPPGCADPGVALAADDSNSGGPGSAPWSSSILLSHRSSIVRAGCRSPAHPMVLMDVTLNVILGNVSCGANVTLAQMRRRTNVTLGPIFVIPTSPPTRPTSPRQPPTSPSVKFHDHSNVTPTRPTSPSRSEGRHRWLVSGASCGDSSYQTLAAASRDAARRRHGDARLRRRLDRLGSITGLRFSLGLRPPVTPIRWPGISASTGARVNPCSHAAQNGR